MPRPSSPLNAKASTRSPYALDRSQQNSCALDDDQVREPRRLIPVSTHQFCFICQTMMSSQVRPGQHRVDVRPNPSFTMSKHSRRRAGVQFCHLYREICSPRWVRLGGARRSRTDDLMLAKHALYQLSYGPSSGSLVTACFQGDGRPGQTRTADLTLIRRTL